MSALEQGSRLSDMQGQAPIVDGLQTKRERAVAFDAAYRFFATDTRRYIAADAPGDIESTRNMAAGASTADLAIVVVDAGKGVLTQTRRHSRILSLMGVRQVVLAINKLDLTGFNGDIFDAIVSDYLAFAAALDFSSVQCVPICARDGDNIRVSSARTPWHSGPSVLDCLERAEHGFAPSDGAFRMPVQSVSRPNSKFRECSGRIAEGTVRPGDRARVQPSGVETQVESIRSGLAEAASGESGESVTITLAGDADVGRGDILVAADAPLEIADQFECRLLWLSGHALAPGRQFLFRMERMDVSATVMQIKYREDIDTGAHLSARTLEMNEIARVVVATAHPLPFSPHRANRRLGGFILIDKLTFETVGAGAIEFALRRSSGIKWQALDIDRRRRELLKHQVAKCVWFTGLPSAGKSTLANLLEQRLYAEGRHSYLLDGDNIRHGLNRDLGFTEADRVENIRRIGEVARLMFDAGLIVLVAFISPFRSEREVARGLFPNGDFIEVFVDATIEECERRDVKGLYARARRGELRNMTGIDSPYEPPESPEVRLDTAREAPEICVDKILRALL